MKSDELWQKALKAVQLPARERFNALKQIGSEVVSSFNEPKDLTLEATATIAVGDLAHSGDDQNYLKLINEGKMYAFNTGSDGPVLVQVRIVDSPEPLLALTEYARVLVLSKTDQIAINHEQEIVRLETIDQNPCHPP